jgi:hypothetical protein
MFFAIALVSATVVAYFHTVQVDLTVGEARSSADLPVTLTIGSGETMTTDKVIHNSANVQLCAELSWNETANANGVTYTNNLPIKVILPAGVDTTTTVSFTANEVTEAGTVTGNINYLKVIC